LYTGQKAHLFQWQLRVRRKLRLAFSVGGRIEQVSKGSREAAWTALIGFPHPGRWRRVCGAPRIVLYGSSFPPQINIMDIGKTLIILGIVIALAGVFVLYGDSLPVIRHLGRLPGDITIRKEHFSVHVPLASGLLISAVLSLVLYLAGRWR